ncbi:MAG: 1-acyl-sn-glycerol-3-phosphate acyltransferase [Pseudohongiellaceae bacterium]
MDKFKDIRPYLDGEIRPVLDKLIKDPEFLVSIAQFYFPRLTKLMPAAMRFAAAGKLKGQLKNVCDIATMQDVIAQYMDKMIEDTTTSLTHSGLENLVDGRNYLFISNHRDIVMDPAFVNYMLYHAGHETLQIAIGDNLLKKPFVSDLMRLNKSFIVQRSLKGRELLKSLKLMSEYIHHSVGHGQNVWIAQSEGRAKDGVDKTDPALLKMLALGNRDVSLGESLNQLHIVPVSISYEYDPCDVLKAEELYQIQETGSFQKNELTDINSIVTGMIGFKGKVHVAFGTELEITEDEPESIANHIDEQILSNYLLSDSNYLALKILQEEGVLAASNLSSDFGAHEIPAVSEEFFNDRLNDVDPRINHHWLYSYANPALNRFKIA